MSLRLYSMSLGGKLSIGYLVASTAILVLVLWSTYLGTDWVALVLGAPLIWLIPVIKEVAGWDKMPQPHGVFFFVALWVANAYLVGYAIVGLLWLVGVKVRRFENQPSHTEPLYGSDSQEREP